MGSGSSAAVQLRVMNGEAHGRASERAFPGHVDSGIGIGMGDKNGGMQLGGAPVPGISGSGRDMSASNVHPAAHKMSSAQQRSSAARARTRLTSRLCGTERLCLREVLHSARRHLAVAQVDCTAGSGKGAGRARHSPGAPPATSRPADSAPTRASMPWQARAPSASHTAMQRNATHWGRLSRRGSRCEWGRSTPQCPPPPARPPPAAPRGRPPQRVGPSSCRDGRRDEREAGRGGGWARASAGVTARRGTPGHAATGWLHAPHAARGAARTHSARADTTLAARLWVASPTATPMPPTDAIRGPTFTPTWTRGGAAGQLAAVGSGLAERGTASPRAGADAPGGSTGVPHAPYADRAVVPAARKTRKDSTDEKGVSRATTKSLLPLQGGPRGR